MKKVVIVSAVRTPVGKIGGQFTTVEPDVLASIAIREAVRRAGIDPSEVEDLYMGNVNGRHGNIAHVAGLMAGLPVEVGGATVDRQCSSGSQAIALAAMSIMCGYGDIYVAGGMESQTLTPYQLAKNKPYSWEPPKFLIPRPSCDEIGNPPMGMTAEKVAAEHGITRQECDEWALESHTCAANAQDKGYFDEQIVPVPVKKKKEIVMIKSDEGVRRDTSMEALGKLKPVFKEDGVVTAGNACFRADGAAALVLMSEDKAKELGIRPLVSFNTYAVAGLHPSIMAYGPVPATQKALKRAGLKASDIGVAEINEAFAAQVVPSYRDIGWDPKIVNPNGGALALGHPLGGTGAVLTTKLIYEMLRCDHKYGVVTMCIGGGQGMATIFEKYD